MALGHLAVSLTFVIAVAYNQRMSTLRATLDQLLELQKIDTDRDRAVRAQRALDPGTQATAEATRAQSAAASVRLEQQQTTTALKDAELELASLEKKIKLYEDRVRSGVISNSKELMNIEKEIGQLVRQRSALDETILSLMDKVEQGRVTVAESEAQASEADQKRQAVLDGAQAERSRIDGLIADLGRRRGESAGMIEDKALLQKYETIRARNNSSGIGIGRTQENTCGACHMQVSSIEAAKARAGDTLVLCENCGRIMA